MGRVPVAIREKGAEAAATADDWRRSLLRTWFALEHTRQQAMNTATISDSGGSYPGTRLHSENTEASHGGGQHYESHGAL